MWQFPMRVKCVDAMPGRLEQGAEYVAESFRWFSFGNAFAIRDAHPFGGIAWFKVERFKPIIRVKMGRAVVPPARWPGLGGAVVTG